MITVLHYCPGFLLGGIESRLLDWYRNIDRNEIRFVLIKLNETDDTEYVKEFVDLGGTFYNLPKITPKTVFSLKKRIREIIRKEHVDVVHVHDISSGYFALSAAKKEKVKIRILHSRTTDYLPGEKNKMIKKMLRKIESKYANRYFACSVDAGKWGVGKKFDKDGVVINNGIQVEQFVFDETKRNAIRKELNIQNRFVVGTIGRLSPQKNLPFLLSVFREIREKQKDSVLLVVGDGNKEIILDNPIYKEFKNDIVLVGSKKNVNDYYFAMDVFCSSSLYEGFGTTAIESQATGLPTLLSKGFPEVVAISDLCKRMDFDKEEWKNNVLAFKGIRKPEEGMKAVVDNGYDAKKVAKYLEKVYRG